MGDGENRSAGLWSVGEGGDEFYIAQSGRCASLLVNAGGEGFDDTFRERTTF
jgi:hypothetical protein